MRNFGLQHRTRERESTPEPPVFRTSNLLCWESDLFVVVPEGSAGLAQQNRSIKCQDGDKEVGWIPAFYKELLQYVFIFCNQRCCYVEIGLGLLFLIKGSNSCKMLQKLERDAPK